MGFEIVRVRLRNTTYCGKTKHLSRLVKSKTWLYGRENRNPWNGAIQIWRWQNRTKPGIYAQTLQVQEKDTVQEIKTATEELSEGLKEIFERTLRKERTNDKWERSLPNKRKDLCTPKRKKNNHKTISRRDDKRISGKQTNLLQCGKKALVAENAARCRGICKNLQRMPKK